MTAEIVEHHEFAGWEVRRATFDYGTKFGIAAERMIDGKKIRLAARAHSAPQALNALKAMVAEYA